MFIKLRNGGLAMAALILCASMISCGYGSHAPETVQSNPAANQISPVAFEGCYELDLSSPLPDFYTPPRMVQLLTAPGDNRSEVKEYLLQPAPQIPPPRVRRSSSWKPVDRDGFEMVWSNGFDGMVLDAKRAGGENFVGSARTFDDVVDSRPYRASLSARKVQCGALPPMKAIPDLVEIDDFEKEPTKMVLAKYPNGIKPPNAAQWVLVNIVVGTSGEIESAGADRCCNDPFGNKLIDAAIAAVKQWKYEPTSYYGKPMKIKTRVDVDFVLDENTPADICWITRHPEAYDHTRLYISGLLEVKGKQTVLNGSESGCAETLVTASDRQTAAKNPAYDQLQNELEKHREARFFQVFMRGMFEDGADREGPSTQLFVPTQIQNVQPVR